MRMIRRSVLLAALHLPYPDGETPPGGSPPGAPPAPPPKPAGPLGNLGAGDDEPLAELDKWKPKTEGEFDQRTLPKDLRDEDPQKVIAKLANVNKGFRDQQARAEKPPEKADGYTFETPAALKEHFPDLANDPAYKALQEGLHEAGLGQTAFTKATGKILAKLAETGVIPKPMTEASEAEKLGGPQKAKERVQAAEAFVATAVANKIFDDGGKYPGRTERLAGALQSMWTHAEGVEFIEILQSGRQEIGPGGGGKPAGGQITAADITARRRDPRYRTDSPTFDRAFRAETDNLAKQLSGGN